MPGPANAGVLVYALDVERLAAFYAGLLSMRRLHADDGLVVLESDDLQLVVHAIPPAIAADLVVTAPPVVREDCALKFFVTVPDLEAASRAAETAGGLVTGPVWDTPRFRMRNVCDPEGNVFQLRGPVAAAAARA